MLSLSALSHAPVEMQYEISEKSREFSTTAYRKQKAI